MAHADWPETRAPDQTFLTFRPRLLPVLAETTPSPFEFQAGLDLNQASAH